MLVPPNRDIIMDCIGDESAVAVKIKIDGQKKHTLCKTCQRYLNGNRMPPMCQNNKLSINHEPKLEKLTGLENSLIAREINFMCNLGSSLCVLMLMLVAEDFWQFSHS